MAGAILDMEHQQELMDVGRVRKKKSRVHGSHNLHGKIEWYTPEEYIVSARTVMGSIDCDPATSSLAQQMIQAQKFFTIDDDGLTHPWTGTVWLNPPYAAKIITPFVEKLIGHIEQGHVSQAIMLTHNNMDTAWAHKAMMTCNAMCFTRGRVRFYDEMGKANAPTHGHCFFYWGRRHRRFANEFLQYGFIAKGYQ